MTIDDEMMEVVDRLTELERISWEARTAGHVLLADVLATSTRLERKDLNLPRVVVLGEAIEVRA